MNMTQPDHAEINTLDRRTQTTTFRLRTRHCGLRKHLKRSGLNDSAQCECGSEAQTPEHIHQTCPLLETTRQQSWPEDTEEGTKLRASCRTTADGRLSSRHQPEDNNNTNNDNNTECISRMPFHVKHAQLC